MEFPQIGCEVRFFSPSASYTILDTVVTRPHDPSSCKEECIPLNDRERGRFSLSVPLVLYLAPYYSKEG